MTNEQNYDIHFGDIVSEEMRKLILEAIYGKTEMEVNND